MFRPGGILWLLRHEFRLSWRGWFKAARSNAGRIVLYLVLAAGLLGAGYGIATLLGYVDPDPTPQVIGVVSAVFAVLATFMASQALILITEALYQRGDLDLLLSSPIPPWRVLIVRMAAIALNVATLYLLLSAAVFVFLPLSGGWRWMGFLPTVLGLALVATALGLVISRGLFLLIGPRNTRVAAQVMAALFGGFFFLVVQAQNFVPYDQRGEMFMRIHSVLADTLGDGRNPISLPARAAMGEPMALATWLAFSVAAYVASVWWFSRRFVANAAAIAGMSARRKADARTREIRGGLARTLVRKEWRLLLRDPLLLSQILLQMVYLLPLVFVLWNGVGHGEMSRGAVGLFSGAFVLLASHLAASLVWLTVSAEDAPELIAAAPVARDKIENAKAFAAGAPVAVLMLIPAIGAAFISVMAGVWLFAGSLLAIASSGLIGIWHQKPGDRKTFRKRRGQSLAASIGQAFITMGWCAATGLAVAGWPLAGLIPALIALGVLLALHESRTVPAPA